MPLYQSFSMLLGSQSISEEEEVTKGYAYRLVVMLVTTPCSQFTAGIHQVGTE